MRASGYAGSLAAGLRGYYGVWPTFARVGDGVHHGRGGRIDAADDGRVGGSGVRVRGLRVKAHADPAPVHNAHATFVFKKGTSQNTQGSAETHPSMEASIRKVNGCEAAPGAPLCMPLVDTNAQLLSAAYRWRSSVIGLPIAHRPGENKKKT